MKSLRLRLFAVLMLATGLVWIAAVGWIYVGSRHEVEHVLDTRLQEAARMVLSLVDGLETLPPAAPGQREAIRPLPTSYERQLSCQIWSLDGRMIARSGGAPAQSLTDQRSGFSERIVNGEPWRVYAVEDAAKGVRILVGDRLGLREKLVTDLIKGLMAPALLIAPLLGFMIWLSVGRGLKPLRAMTQDLGRRDSDDMHPVNAADAPSEIRPLASAINRLLEKVETARRHERDVTALAAHELRTPLAGLRTQAQVALAATDPAQVRAALGQIIIAVDRSTRLVRQLLAIARLDSSAEPVATETVDILPLIEHIAAQTPRPAQVEVLLADDLRNLRLQANRECLELVLRNLHENAVQHMRGAGVVCWRRGEDGQSLRVEDEGPGVPREELGQIGTRFFRGRHRSASGSGLGLAIARMAAARTGGQLTLRNREGAGGLVAEISLPGSVVP